MFTVFTRKMLYNYCHLIFLLAKALKVNSRIYKSLSSIPTLEDNQRLVMVKPRSDNLTSPLSVLNDGGLHFHVFLTFIT